MPKPAPKRKPPPARIYFAPAAQSPLVVILRRKPSKLWHVALLNTNKGTIEHGSWFRGTIYHNRCDLSADGKLLVYLARASDGSNVWTGVCTPPFLRTLWHIPDTFTFGGGGVWVADRTLSLFSGIKPQFIPPIPADTQSPSRRPVPLFTLAPYQDPRQTAASAIAQDRREAETSHDAQLVSTTPAYTSIAKDYKNRLLIARNGAIEIWTKRDLKSGRPSHLIDLEHLKPPPRQAQR